MEAEAKATLGDHLYQACTAGDLSTISEFTTSQQSLDETYTPPLPALMDVATSYDHAHIVSWCLSQGATVTDSIMRTLISAGSFATHKVLIEAGAVGIDYYVTWFGTALSVAATSGRYEWAKYCLEKGADANYPRPVDEYKSIVAGAAENGKMDIVELLLENGARLQGSGALVVAAEAGRVDIVRFLLGREDVDVNEMGVEHPTDPRETEEVGTALHKAATEGHGDIVRLLVIRGVDMQLRDRQGRTAVALARENGYAEIVDFLRDSGAE